MNGAISQVNKKFIYHLTWAKPTPSAAATVQVSHALPAVRSLLLTEVLRGQFPRWRRSRKRLSVCSVLRCPDLWLQCTQKAFSCCGAILETSPAVSTSERTACSAWETWTVVAADGVGFARVRWEIDFLLTFEIAPFIFKHPVYLFAQNFPLFF